MVTLRSKLEFGNVAHMMVTIFIGIAGFVILNRGREINALFYRFNDLLEEEYFAPAVYLFAVSSLLIITSIIGIAAAVNNYILALYIIILLLELFLEFTIILDLTSSIKKIMFDKVDASKTLIISKYRSEPEFRVNFDALQHGFSCCGLYNSNDWSNIYNNGSMPQSCCHKHYANGTCRLYYTYGCFQSSDLQLTVAFWNLVGYQIAALIFAVYLGHVRGLAANSPEEVKKQSSKNNSYDYENDCYIDDDCWDDCCCGDDGGDDCCNDDGGDDCCDDDGGDDGGDD